MPEFVRPEYIVFALLGLVIVIIVYIAQAIFLSKFHKLVYGKGTILGWIPVCNLYIVGKMAVNKLVGWILVGAWLLTGSLTITVGDSKSTYSILPESIRSIFTNIYSLVVLGLFIFAIVKYVKLKKTKYNAGQNQNSNMQSSGGDSLNNNSSFMGNVNSSNIGGSQTNMNMQDMNTFSAGMSSTNTFFSTNLNAETSVNETSPVQSQTGSSSENLLQNSNTVSSETNFISNPVTSVPTVDSQNINLVSQQGIASGSDGSLPAGGVGIQNVNPSPAVIPDTPAVDMSKPVVDVFQFVNPEASSSTNNPATTSGDSVESLQTDDTIK